MNYSKAIRVARSLADLSQGELADRAEIDRSYLSLIESGKRQASIETIEKIATGLGLPFHLLALLGSEPHDIRKTNASQIESLSLALTKLLLQEPKNDDSGEESGKSDTRDETGSTRTRPPKKPPGSGTSPRNKTRNTAIAG
jgi:transcriptional regulator with XRE-family HTH domain